MQTIDYGPQTPGQGAVWLSGLSIRTRIFLGFGITLAILAALSLTTTGALRSAGGQFTAYATDSDLTRDIMSIDRDIIALRRNFLAFAKTNNQRGLKRIQEIRDQLATNIARAMTLIKPADQRALMQEASTIYKELMPGLTRAIQLKTQIDTSRAEILDRTASAVDAALGQLGDAATERREVEAVSAAATARDRMLRVRLALNRLLDRDDESAATTIAGDLTQARQATASLVDRLGIPAERAVADPLPELLARYATALSETMAAHAELHLFVDKTWDERSLKIVDTVDAIVKLANDGVAANRDATSGALSWSISFNQCLAAAGLVIGAVLAWTIGRGIVVPIAMISAAMDRLAAGDKQAAIPGRTRRDEVGSMAKSVEAFRVGLLRADEIDRDGRRATEDNDARARKIREEQASVIVHVRGALEAVASGDLTRRLESPFPVDYESLREAVNATIDRLSEVIAEVGETARTIDASSAEVAHAADDLAQRTQQQAAGLEETAAATEELSSTVKQTAETAREAEMRTDAARGIAEAGSRIAADTIDAMVRIEKSSKEMVAIVDVIEEIAFQTNLLALNAGVEAARAGEAGMGFAVVATEVRALAQRCGEAAKQIKTLILSSETHVANGVKLVRAGGDSLQQIVASVTEITTMVQQIAGACRQQSTGISETTQTLGTIDQNTQQNAAMVEETTAAARSLSGEAARLVDLVGRFLLAGGSARPGSSASAARRQDRSRPSPRLAQAG